MSQQEMFPESQESRSQDDEQIGAQPYYWYTQPKANTGNMPKNEHPLTFEETIPPHAYRAQEPVREPQQQQEQVKSNYQRQQFSPDGDAFEQGYRPYQQPLQAQVPPWARPQTNNRGMWRWLPLLIIGFMVLPVLLHFILGLIAVVGILALVFIIPLILIVLVIGGMFFFGTLFFRVGMRRRWRYGGPMRWNGPMRWRGRWRW